MDIFILCTYSEGGRFVQAATTDPTTAGENHERLLGGLVADGWHVGRTQLRDLNDGTEGVALSSVVHLSNDAGRWLNVEEYHTTE